MLVTLLSVILLGEKVGWRRLAAILTGFMGAIIVIRPSFVSVGWPVLYPAAAALCFSFYILLTRTISAIENPIKMQFFAGVSGMCVVAAGMVFGAIGQLDGLSLTWPVANEWALIIVFSLLGTVGHLLVVYAFKCAPVSVLAPFQYIEIIGATILGWIIFEDFPEPATWLGISFIVASGIYIFHRESKLKL